MMYNDSLFGFAVSDLVVVWPFHKVRQLSIKLIKRINALYSMSQSINILNKYKFTTVHQDLSEE